MVGRIKSPSTEIEPRFTHDVPSRIPSPLLHGLRKTQKMNYDTKINDSLKPLLNEVTGKGCSALQTKRFPLSQKLYKYRFSYYCLHAKLASPDVAKLASSDVAKLASPDVAKLASPDVANLASSDVANLASSDVANLASSDVANLANH